MPRMRPTAGRRHAEERPQTIERPKDRSSALLRFVASRPTSYRPCVEKPAGAARIGINRPDNFRTPYRGNRPQFADAPAILASMTGDCLSRHPAENPSRDGYSTIAPPIIVMSTIMSTIATLAAIVIKSRSPPVPGAYTGHASQNTGAKSVSDDTIANRKRGQCSGWRWYATSNAICAGMDGIARVPSVPLRIPGILPRHGAIRATASHSIQRAAGLEGEHRENRVEPPSRVRGATTFRRRAR